MDRRRNRKNAISTKIRGKKAYYISLFVGASLLLSCSRQEQQQLIPVINPFPQQQINNSNVAELTMQQRFARVLSSHNYVRRKYNLPPLKWSNQLANYSQEWANHLGRGNQCQMFHRSGNPPFGENLYISSAEVWREDNGREVDRKISPVTIADVVNAWASEEKFYNYQQNRCQRGQQCGHYTQIVWKDTREVGCAMKVCPDKSQTWVCSYNPPGNYVGFRPY